VKPIKVFSYEWGLMFGAYMAAFIAGYICSGLDSWWTPFIAIMGGIILHDYLIDKLRARARVDALRDARKIVRDVRAGR
jgi:hypothetical protein